MGLGSELRAKIRRVVARHPALHDIAMQGHSRGDIFSDAYACRAWGSAESGSGIGSELEATTALRAYLPQLFKRLDIHTFLDAPCGDWNWMRLVDLHEVDYIGADVVPSVITNNQAKFAHPGLRFLLADLTQDDLPRVDLILCRDCWIHISFKDIAAMLENFRHSGASYLLTTNSPTIEKNRDKQTGLGWRHLNLRKAPFNFPEPLEARKDHYPGVPFEITLWHMADLPSLKI